MLAHRLSRSLLRETRRGTERISLNFSDVARALREFAQTLSSRRIWLILDELIRAAEGVPSPRSPPFREGAGAAAH